MAGNRREKATLRRDSVFVSGKQGAWLTIQRSLLIIYHDVYDEHLFVFAAGLSYYFVLSLFPFWFPWQRCSGMYPSPTCLRAC